MRPTTAAWSTWVGALQRGVQTQSSLRDGQAWPSIGLAKVLAKEGAEHNVTANGLLPGGFRAPLR